MNTIRYINRLSQKIEIESIYHEKLLRLLYDEGWINRIVRCLFISPIAKFSFISWVYGNLQKTKRSRKKIIPFVEQFNIDTTEFLNPVSSFLSFNDFFIRKLKKEARPLSKSPAIIPADGRYYFFENIATCSGFVVKGEKFNLEKLLNSSALAQTFSGGSMVIGRLCPSDYHRFHFPVDGFVEPAQLINGFYFSVNPLAVRKNIDIFTDNKRMVTLLHSDFFGEVLYIEIGATNVGSIQQTYTPYRKVKKGDEKGFFEFGASALILLFKQNTIAFDADLVAATAQGLEVRCLFGQSMGYPQRR